MELEPMSDADLLKAVSMLDKLNRDQVRVGWEGMVTRIVSELARRASAKREEVRESPEPIPLETDNVRIVQIEYLTATGRETCERVTVNDVALCPGRWLTSTEAQFLRWFLPEAMPYLREALWVNSK